MMIGPESRTEGGWLAEQAAGCTSRPLCPESLINVVNTCK
jgi:hypothetical protein